MDGSTMTGVMPGTTTPGPTTTVRGATLDLLRALGMTTVFGNPGSTELGLLDRWPADFTYVLGLQEASVVGMADGYARATGRAAFVNLHSAAGVGHALGNLFTAYKNGAPLVVTAGQQARSLLPNLPFLGATEAANFPKPYVKFSVEPARPEDVPAAIAQAHRIATQRPYGPTFVSVPADDWSARCAPVLARPQYADVAPDPAAVEEAARLLAAARRPVIVSGAEADAEGAGHELVAFAERLGAPVLTAPFASRLAFPEDHPLHAGHMVAAPEAVAEALLPYDLVLVVGAPVFTFHVAGDCGLFRGRVPLIHLTTDRDAGAASPYGMTVLGSLRHALPMLASRVPHRGLALPKPRPRPAPPKATNPIPAAWALSRLRAALPEDAVLVEEAPSHRPAMHAQLPMTRWGGFFTMASGGLGYSLPGAVGVALGRPGTRVACLIGDGSFLYSPQALWTAVQHRLPVAVVVLNNGGYGAMRSFSRVLGVRDVPGIDIEGVGFVGMARSMGCPGVRVTDHRALDAALRDALAADGPFLVEVAVDPAIPNLYGKQEENETMPDTHVAPDATFARHNPITGDVATTARAMTVAEALAVTDAAAAAFPAWSALGPNARRAHLLKAADLLAAKAPDFIRLMAEELGATAGWAGFNVHLAAGMLREAAAMTTQVIGETIPSDKPGCLSMTVRAPVGVVFGMAPWNAPVILGIRAVALPLACGNAVVLKASETCPGVHALLAAVFEEAGLPPGVVGVVTHSAADAPAVVNAVISHRAVKRVNFTGSTKVGKLIAVECARHLKPMLLELGGKAPMIVLEDADLDEAVKAAAFGAFMNQGQICMSTERIVVVDAVADAFVRRFSEFTATLPVGDPRGGPVFLGSVVDEKSAAFVEELVGDAKAKGAEVHGGAARIGTIMPAAIVDRVTKEMRLYAEESFGPVVAVIRVADEEEAVRVANDTEYGLSAAVFTRDVARGLSVAGRIESGICHVNGPTVHDEAQMPFGGVKGSGYGRFGGRAGINEFTELRWITVETRPGAYPFPPAAKSPPPATPGAH